MASERVTDGGYRDIIGFLVVGDLSFTGRKQRNGKKLSPGIDFLSSPFPDFHASIALLPQILRSCLAINLGWKTAGETKRDRHRRAVDASPVIANGRVIRRIALLPFRCNHGCVRCTVLSTLPAVARQFICDRN